MGPLDRLQLAAVIDKAVIPAAFQGFSYIVVWVVWERCAAKGEARQGEGVCIGKKTGSILVPARWKCPTGPEDNDHEDGLWIGRLRLVVDTPGVNEGGHRLQIKDQW